MATLGCRKVYDDDGVELREGSLAFINGEFVRVIFFNELDEIDIADFRWEDIRSMEQIPNHRYETIDAHINTYCEGRGQQDRNEA